MPLPEIRTEAWERTGDPGRWVFTVEHASRRIPAPLRTTATDRAWLRTHWGWDIGVRTVTRQLVRDLGGAAICARFSRLLCDPNRDPTRSDLVRQVVGGHPLSFNDHLPEVEVMRRLLHYHRPYHDAVDALVRDSLAVCGQVRIVAVHSFTPVWNMHVRPMEVGVLFDEHEDDASRLAEAIADQGFAVALNEPYSGKGGLMYAAHLHGTRHAQPYLELELNQSLLLSTGHARSVASRIGRALIAAFPG